MAAAEFSGYALLGGIDTPADLRRLPADQLPVLAAEIRRYLIDTLAQVGGHFAANLGTVELTLALHRVLNTPQDRLVWDVGHQAYAHKIVTGRRAALGSIRRLGGLAPFLVRAESEFDAFGGGHAGTAISAAAGMAAAMRVKGENRRVVAVIGDGGLTAGASFEALNHIGCIGLDVLIVGNDNDMSISENVGGLRDGVARQLARLGSAAPHRLRPAREDAGVLAAPADFFHALGIRYAGPVDGHDLPALESAIAAATRLPGPQFLHVITVKGKGFGPAESDPIAYHGVTRFDPVTGALPRTPAAPTASFSQVFGSWLCEAAGRDPRVVAITPAMREGSGLVEFAARFPDRFFDVGIAEQHAVSLAAGLAAEGLRPVVAIYATFLQRAYDQLIQDVAIQKLPVIFAIDRAGLVGPDGATHHGAFDLAYLRCIPNLVVMAPSDDAESRLMLGLALDGSAPSAIRYPRGPAAGGIRDPIADTGPRLIGKARIRREASLHQDRARVALLSLGPLLGPALDAAENLDATVVDLRFVKPLDEGLIRHLADSHALLVTIEDHAKAGGVGAAVAELIGTTRTQTRLLRLGLPDEFVGHGTRDELLSLCGLDAPGILRAIREHLAR